MEGPLILSQYNNQPVYISSRIVSNLTIYQIDSIRFLYQCYIKDRNHNVILNNDFGMNEERQISAILSAIKRSHPTLIICLHENLKKWYYEFSQANMKVVTANELIQNESWEAEASPDVVLLTHNQLKHIKVLPYQDWFFVVVQNFENLVNSRYIRNINAEFKIGIITTSFVDLTSDLQWLAMKWTNSDSVGNKNKFVETDNFNKTNHLWPFPRNWKRITWDMYKKFKPSEIHIKEYENTVDEWCKIYNPALLEINTHEIKKSRRKRSNTKIELDKKLKKRRINTNQNFQITYLSTDSEESENNNLCQKTSSDSDDSTEILNKSGKDIAIKQRSSSMHSIASNISSPNCKNNFILDSFNENSQNGPAINERDIKKFQNEENISSVVVTNSKIKNEENNFILDSLLDYPETDNKNKNSKEFSISDDENESCPILDLLFDT